MVGSSSTKAWAKDSASWSGRLECDIFRVAPAQAAEVRGALARVALAGSLSPFQPEREETRTPSELFGLRRAWRARRPEVTIAVAKHD